jgi:hypothetical protein
MNLAYCPWDGSSLGKQKPESKIKWGSSRSVTYIQNITVVKVPDPNSLAAIMDEFILAFGIYKIGTFTYKTSSGNYTAYSFMTGEHPYEGDIFELNELRDRWYIYYTWWNIALKPEDIYYRKYLRTNTVVAYPNSCMKKENILKDYTIKVPAYMDEKKLIVTLRSWINCNSVSDIDLFINKARGILLDIFKRLSVDNMDMVGTIISRIRNYLLYYLTEEGQEILKTIK